MVNKDVPQDTAVMGVPAKPGKRAGRFRQEVTLFLASLNAFFLLKPALAGLFFRLMCMRSCL